MTGVMLGWEAVIPSLSGVRALQVPFLRASPASRHRPACAHGAYISVARPHTWLRPDKYSHPWILAAFDSDYACRLSLVNQAGAGRVSSASNRTTDGVCGAWLIRPSGLHRP